MPALAKLQLIITALGDAPITLHRRTTSHHHPRHLRKPPFTAQHTAPPLLRRGGRQHPATMACVWHSVLLVALLVVSGCCSTATAAAAAAAAEPVQQQKTNQPEPFLEQSLPLKVLVSTPSELAAGLEVDAAGGLTLSGRQAITVRGGFFWGEGRTRDRRHAPAGGGIGDTGLGPGQDGGPVLEELLLARAPRF